MKTGSEIQGDIYALLRNSELAGSLSGKVYRRGYRPRDSRLEDAVVIFTAGLAEQVESGVVTVNIFVPDITPYGDGAWYENGQRTAEIERLAQEWVDSLTPSASNYKFRLEGTIRTEESQDTHEHFVVVKLRYEHYDGNQ